MSRTGYDIHLLQGDPWQNLAAAIIERAWLDAVDALVKRDWTFYEAARADFTDLCRDWTDLDPEPLMRYIIVKAKQLKDRRLMMVWKKIDTGINAAGEKTVTYELEGSKKGVLVQSVVKKIPHAARDGYWETRRYHMIFRGIRDPRAFTRLSDARREAERIGKKLGYLGGPSDTEGDDAAEQIARMIEEAYR